MGAFKGVGLWTPSDHRQEGIATAYADLGIGVTTPTAAQMQTYVASIKRGLEYSAGPNSVSVWHALSLCNNTQPGWYGEANFTSGARQIHEQIALTIRDKAYIATYTRYGSTPIDPLAHAALATLCAPAAQSNAGSPAVSAVAPSPSLAAAPSPQPQQSAPVARPNPTTSHDPTVLARQWLARMQTKDVDASQLTPEMAAVLTPQTINSVSAQLAALGQPIALTLLQSMHQGALTGYAFKVTFHDATIREVINLTDDGKIAGLFFVPQP